MNRFPAFKLHKIAILMCLLALHASSQAATATASIAVTSVVLASCSVTGSSVAFGNYNSTQIDQTASLAMLCTTGTTYTVVLDAGTGSGATTGVRKMTGPASATLNYALYRDSGHTNTWGNATGTDTMAGTGTGLSQNMSVYGRLTGGQSAAAGSYTDTVVVTMTY